MDADPAFRPQHIFFHRRGFQINGFPVGQPDEIVKLEGAFAKSPVKQFPAGTFHVDMAQPMANMAFYCLEPEAYDGFVAWDVLTDYLESIQKKEVEAYMFGKKCDMNVFKDPMLGPCSCAAGSSRRRLKP